MAHIVIWNMKLTFEEEKKTLQFYPEAQTEQICNLFDVNLIIYIAKK